MSEEMNGIDPKGEFQVFKRQPLSDVEERYVDLLYLPIIGPSSYALYCQLFNTQMKVNHSNFELMSILNIDAVKLQRAFYRLEGAGLLKAFINHSELGNKTDYLLEEPLPPTEFFSDNLLSLALLEHIGENYYLELSQKLFPRSFDFSDLDDQTKNFLEVFSVNSHHITNQPDVLKQVKRQADSLADEQDAPKEDDYSSDFDFNLVLSILKNSFVNIKSVEKYEGLLKSTNALYGTDEVEIAKLVEKATSLINNRFNPTKFKLLVSRANQIKGGQVKKTGNRGNSSLQNLSQKEKRLCQIASQTAPMEFLNSLKVQKGGFTTSSEERILQDLTDRGIFNNGAINLLIYHLLIDEDHPTLNKNLVETIANDWQQRGINDAAGAINEIKNRKVKSRKPKRKRGRISEKLPKWAQETKKTEQNDITKPALSSVQKERISERLKRLNKQNRGD